MSGRAILCVTVVLGSVACTGEIESDEGARSILARMSETYAGLATYEDHGVQGVVSDDPERHRGDVKQFSTAFVRDDRFRFEVLDLDMDAGVVIYDDHGETWSSLFGKTEKHAASLGDVLGVHVGVSLGLSTYVPGLLFPEDDLGWFRSLREFVRLEDAHRDGERLLRVQGLDHRGDAWRLWIESETLALVRLETCDAIDDFEEVDYVDFVATMSAPVSEPSLAFDRAVLPDAAHEDGNTEEDKGAEEREGPSMPDIMAMMARRRDRERLELTSKVEAGAATVGEILTLRLYCHMANDSACYEAAQSAYAPALQQAIESGAHDECPWLDAE